MYVHVFSSDFSAKTLTTTRRRRTITTTSITRVKYAKVVLLLAHTRQPPTHPPIPCSDTVRTSSDIVSNSQRNRSFFPAKKEALRKIPTTASKQPLLTQLPTLIPRVPLDTTHYVCCWYDTRIMHYRGVQRHFHPAGCTPSQSTPPAYRACYIAAASADFPHRTHNSPVQR